MIKTFRGLIADDGIDTIVLHTNDGSIGYRIVKLQLFPHNYGSANAESLVKIFKTPQSLPTTSVVDFSDQTLLAVAGIGNSTASNVYPPGLAVIFDREIFNQDIYVTHQEEQSGAESVNYYLELEQVKLDLSENTVATLKDIRNLS